MIAPLRYRAALRAYPPRYRSSHAEELLATLADGDDERGGPSNREAAALTWRGLTMRARLTLEPEGLLVLAAALVLLALAGGFTWADRPFLFHGEVAAWATDAPDRWWSVALLVTAVTAIGALCFGAADSRRRRGVASLLAVSLVLGSFATLRFLFVAGIPETAAAIYANWQRTLMDSVVAAAGTWFALGWLAQLSQGARVRRLAILLGILSAVVIFQIWHRPDLAAEYAQSALADLGPAPFIAAAGLLFALAALVRVALCGTGPRSSRSRF